MRTQAGTTEGETPITATLPDHGTEQGWGEWDDWEAFEEEEGRNHLYRDPGATSSESSPHDSPGGIVSGPSAFAQTPALPRSL